MSDAISAEDARASATVASEEVTGFLAARRTPRARATRKLEQVVERLIAAEPPADRARDLWVHGSYARGAPDVGDLDLFLRVDEERDPRQQALDAYYRGAHPYAEIVRALGCGGSSIVNLDVQPIFAPAPEPISPERARAGSSPQQEVPVQPRFRHVVTGDPFEPQPLLVWVRGDSMAQVHQRLYAIRDDATARRFERTTTVPLIDTLLSVLGVETGFLLAAQIRAGNLDVNATVLAESEPPSEVAKSLAARYRSASDRYRAAAAALAYLKADGVALNRVVLANEPVTRPARKRQAEVSFNSFLIYRVAASGLSDGWRHVQVWPTPRHSRWLALDLHVLNSRATRDLYWYLTPTDGRGDRYEPIRRALGMPSLPTAPDTESADQ